MSTITPTVPVDRNSAYGRLIGAAEIEQAILDTIRLWAADYLAELDRLNGQPVGTLPYPRSWTVTGDDGKMPEDQLPAIRAISPGVVSDQPAADGQGRYTARWRMDVATIVSARGNDNALRVARLYALAVRALIIQQQNLGGTLPVRRVEWQAERYDTLPTVDDRTVCIATVRFVIEVADVTSRHQGPITPVLPPGNLDPDSPTWPAADTVDTDIIKEPIA